MSESFCPDCKRSTEVVLGHSAGDTVCLECGLVLEAHSIDETSKWRTFANASGDNDPNRTGGPSNPLLTDGGLFTVISKPNGAHGDFLSSLGRWQNRGNNADRTLIVAFRTIATMPDRLGIVATIKDTANEIYKKVEDLKSIRGINQDAILAACLYIACRQEDKPHIVKEICYVANGATKKEVGRAKECIVKQLEGEMGQSMELGSIRAGDFLRRFLTMYLADKSDLLGIDVFVSPADPEKESPLMTANTILSILAADYPVKKLACYVSDDGDTLLTFEAMAETASFVNHPAVKNGHPPGALTLSFDLLDVSTVAEAIFVISCWYEDKIEGGQHVGWIYDSSRRTKAPESDYVLLLLQFVALFCDVEYVRSCSCS